MLEKRAMFDEYLNLNAATVYMTGFIFENDVYMVEEKSLNFDFIKFEKQSAKNGATYAMRLRPSKEAKKELVKNATYIGPAEILNDETHTYNRGDMFEKIMAERLGLEWKKGNLPFYKGGDISYNGEEIQVKFETATLISEKTLEHTKEILRKQS